MTNIIKQKTGVLLIDRRVHFILGALIFAALISYIYFANTAVRTLTVLERTRAQMQTLSMYVSEMESKKLNLENSLNTEKAIHLGFVEINHPTFIIKGDRQTALSLKTN